MEVLKWYFGRTDAGRWFSRRADRTIEFVGATKGEALSFNSILHARDVSHPEYYATYEDEKAGKISRACETCGQVPGHLDGQSCEVVQAPPSERL